MLDAIAIPQPVPAKWERLDTLFQSKYHVGKGSPYWYAQPSKVLAWDGAGLQTMTRWLFPKR